MNGGGSRFVYLFFFFFFKPLNIMQENKANAFIIITHQLINQSKKKIIWLGTSVDVFF